LCVEVTPAGRAGSVRGKTMEYSTWETLRDWLQANPKAVIEVREFNCTLRGEVDSFIIKNGHVRIEMKEPKHLKEGTWVPWTLNNDVGASLEVTPQRHVGDAEFHVDIVGLVHWNFYLPRHAIGL